VKGRSGCATLRVDRAHNGAHATCDIVFPDLDCVPASRPQLPPGVAVTPSRAAKLRDPKTPVGLWQGQIAFSAPVPETAVYEHGNPSLPEHQVGRARQGIRVQPIAGQSRFTEQSPQAQLERRIPRFVGAHGGKCDARRRARCWLSYRWHPNLTATVPTPSRGLMRISADFDRDSKTPTNWCPDACLPTTHYSGTSSPFALTETIAIASADFAAASWAKSLTLASVILIE